MKPSEIRMILKIILVGLLIIGIILLVRNNKNDETNEEGFMAGDGTQVVEENGTKEITITEEKEVSGLKFTSITVKEENGVLEVRASVTNNLGVERAESPIKIKIMNKTGEVLQEIGAYVGTLRTGETREISASVNMSAEGIHDIEFVI